MTNSDKFILRNTIILKQAMQILAVFAFQFEIIIRSYQRGDGFFMFISVLIFMSTLGFVFQLIYFKAVKDYLWPRKW